jgi:hypothetical protein
VVERSLCQCEAEFDSLEQKEGQSSSLPLSAEEANCPIVTALCLGASLCCSAAHEEAGLPLSGLKKLKKDSVGTCLLMVLTVPRPLCFCFFLMVFTVTFFPFFQSIAHLGEHSHCDTLQDRHQLWCTEEVSQSSMQTWKI